MTCQRCHGLTVRERLDRRGRWWWKCMACGDRIDGLILRNRAEQDAMRADLARAHDRGIREWSLWLAGVSAVSQ